MTGQPPRFFYGAGVLTALNLDKTIQRAISSPPLAINFPPLLTLPPWR
jgi:hypothetical protein